VEKRDCDFCRQYDHWSFHQADPKRAHLAGECMYLRGKPMPRSSRSSPDCFNCPKARYKWTAENARTYRRWRLWAMGAQISDLSAGDLWAFLVLDETDREIQADIVVDQFSRMLGSAVGHGRK